MYQKWYVLSSVPAFSALVFVSQTGGWDERGARGFNKCFVPRFTRGSPKLLERSLFWGDPRLVFERQTRDRGTQCGAVPALVFASQTHGWDARRG